jgi:hypothetical protein
MNCRWFNWKVDTKIHVWRKIQSNVSFDYEWWMYIDTHEKRVMSTPQNSQKLDPLWDPFLSSDLLTSVWVE